MKTLLSIILLLAAVAASPAQGVKPQQPRTGKYTGTVSFRQVGDNGRMVATTARVIATFEPGNLSITTPPVNDGSVFGKYTGYAVQWPTDPFDTTVHVAPVDQYATPGTFVTGSFFAKGNLLLIKLGVNEVDKPVTVFTLTWVAKL